LFLLERQLNYAVLHTEHFSSVMLSKVVYIVTAELERVKGRRIVTTYPFEVRW